MILEDPSSLRIRVGARKEIISRLMKNLPWPKGTHFLASGTAIAVERVMSRELDMAICGEKPDSTEVVAKPLFKDDPVFCMQKKLFHKMGEKINRGLLIGAYSLWYKENPPFIKKFCGRHNVEIERLKIHAIVEDWNLLIELVEQGAGWSVVPSSIEMDKNKLALKYLPKSDFPSQQFYLVTHRDLIRIPIIREFWDAL
ncbi:MAG: substrate-binding domain-containing protein [Planctomycetota bacterium]